MVVIRLEIKFYHIVRIVKVMSLFEIKWKSKQLGHKAMENNTEYENWLETDDY